MDGVELTLSSVSAGSRKGPVPKGKPRGRQRPAPGPAAASIIPITEPRLQAQPRHELSLLTPPSQPPLPVAVTPHVLSSDAIPPSPPITQIPVDRRGSASQAEATDGMPLQRVGVSSISANITTVSVDTRRLSTQQANVDGSQATLSTTPANNKASISQIHRPNSSFVGDLHLVSSRVASVNAPAFKPKMVSRPRGAHAAATAPVVTPASQPPLVEGATAGENPSNPVAGQTRRSQPVLTPPVPVPPPQLNQPSTSSLPITATRAPIIPTGTCSISPPIPTLGFQSGVSVMRSHDFLDDDEEEDLFIPSPVITGPPLIRHTAAPPLVGSTHAPPSILSHMARHNLGESRTADVHQVPAVNAPPRVLSSHLHLPLESEVLDHYPSDQVTPMQTGLDQEPSLAPEENNYEITEDNLEQALLSRLIKDAFSIGKVSRTHLLIMEEQEEERRRKREGSRPYSPSVTPGGGSAARRDYSPALSETSVRSNVEQSAAPRLMMVNGELIVDQTSLMLQHEQVNEEEYEQVEEGPRRYITSSSFSKRKRMKRVKWDADKTELFYKGIMYWGTNFSMITLLFDDMDRKQIKAKYNSEERLHPMKLTEALRRRLSAPPDVISEVKERQQEKLLKRRRGNDSDDESATLKQFKMDETHSQTAGPSIGNTAEPVMLTEGAITGDVEQDQMSANIDGVMAPALQDEPENSPNSSSVNAGLIPVLAQEETEGRPEQILAELAPIPRRLGGPAPQIAPRANMRRKKVPKATSSQSHGLRGDVIAPGTTTAQPVEPTFTPHISINPAAEVSNTPSGPPIVGRADHAAIRGQLIMTPAMRLAHAPPRVLAKATVTMDAEESEEGLVHGEASIREDWEVTEQND
ncbi:Transcription factor TFIIIB component B [Gaertneriomyces sp. JEL0708]|nr:Transcription factor TFIIIB component B [Gaertneriomyces sp. JEL0708]